MCPTWFSLSKKSTTIPDAHRKKRASWKFSAQQIDKQVNNTDLQICVILMALALATDMDGNSAQRKSEKKIISFSNSTSIVGVRYGKFFDRCLQNTGDEEKAGEKAIWPLS